MPWERERGMFDVNSVPGELFLSNEARLSLSILVVDIELINGCAVPDLKTS